MKSSSIFTRDYTQTAVPYLIRYLDWTRLTYAYKSQGKGKSSPSTLRTSSPTHHQPRDTLTIPNHPTFSKKATHKQKAKLEDKTQWRNEYSSRFPTKTSIPRR